MRIIAVDDERHALHALENAILEAFPDAKVNCFLTTEDALEFAGENKVDIAFLDIEMMEVSGLALADSIQDINNKTNIIFVTAYEEYMIDAFKMHASGYVLKPINPDHVIKEIENLRWPIDKNDKINIQCFGNFEVFKDNIPVIFNRPKSKEILAYLIDRHGAIVTRKEIAAVLWEDKSYSRSIQSHLHILVSELISKLKEIDADDVIIKKQGMLAVDTSKVKCDFYDYERSEAEAISNYHGEYMSNYSWAEFTAGTLSNQQTPSED